MRNDNYEINQYKLYFPKTTIGMDFPHVDLLSTRHGLTKILLGAGESVVKRKLHGDDDGLYISSY